MPVNFRVIMTLARATVEDAQAVVQGLEAQFPHPDRVVGLVPEQRLDGTGLVEAARVAAERERITALAAVASDPAVIEVVTAARARREAAVVEQPAQPVERVR